MAISLYDVSVANFLQTVGAVEGFLAKAAAHFKEKGVDPNEVVEARLAPDMLPFRFQIQSVAHHSLGAMHGVQAGQFSPGGPRISCSRSRCRTSIFTPPLPTTSCGTRACHSASATLRASCG